jgi:hypothetical protein
MYLTLIAQYNDDTNDYDVICREMGLFSELERAKTSIETHYWNRIKVCFEYKEKYNSTDSDLEEQIKDEINEHEYYIYEHILNNVNEYTLTPIIYRVDYNYTLNKFIWTNNGKSKDKDKDKEPDELQTNS